MNEQWRPIEEFEGYAVSDFGNVRSKRLGRNMRLSRRRKDGYTVVTLSKDGRKKQFAVHRLVAEAFIGSIPDEMTVNHISGNKADNSIPNLEIVTLAENHRHAFRLGLRRPPMTKLNTAQVAEIRLRYAVGVISKCALAREYGVSDVTIGLIVRRKAWNNPTFELVKE